MKKLKGLISLSGGMDSTTLLYWAINKGYNMFAVAFDYGQNHKKELKLAKWHCKKLNIPFEIIKLDFLNKISNSSLTNGAEQIPEGHYAEDNMKSTVVPFRNGIFLSILTAYAEANEIDCVFLGNHLGDHCFSEDTNILTVEGNKTVKTLNIGDVIYSFNLNKNQWEKDVVTDIIKKNTVNKINLIKTRAGNIKLTDEHKVYRLKIDNFNPVHGYEKSIEKVKVSDLNIGDYLVQPTNLVSPKVEENFNIVELAAELLKNYNKHPKLNIENGNMWLGSEKYKHLGIPININMKAFVNIMAWYIAEGWSSKSVYESVSGQSRFRASFCQSIKENLEKVELILNDLNSINTNFKKEFSKTLHNGIPKDVTFYISNIMSVFLKEGGSHSTVKKIPEWLFKLLINNVELREEFIHTMTLADGHNAYRNNKGFCSSSPTLVEQMITLIQLSGYHFSLENKYKDSKVQYINYSQKGKKSALVSLGDAKFVKIKEIEVVDYNAHVYDISVENNHNFLAGEYASILISNSVYPDCRTEFVDAYAKAAKEGTYKRVEIVTPFTDITKSDICKFGLNLKVPYEKTWSCYKGGNQPCGRCGTCVERTEAFLDNDSIDPLYDNSNTWNEAIKFYKGL